MNQFEEKKEINLRSSEKVGSKEKMENLEEKKGCRVDGRGIRKKIRGKREKNWL